MLQKNTRMRLPELITGAIPRSSFLRLTKAIYLREHKGVIQ